MNKRICILLLFVSWLFVEGCSSSSSSAKSRLIPTNNKGGYRMIVIKKDSKSNNKELVIKGRVFDVKTDSLLSLGTQLNFICTKIQANPQGEYIYKFKVAAIGDKVKIDKKDYFFIEAISFGYKRIRTDYLEINNASEIQIDFYLELDDTPLVDCMPAYLDSIKRAHKENILR